MYYLDFKRTCEIEILYANEIQTTSIHITAK